MRATLILFVTASLPIFCQESGKPVSGDRLPALTLQAPPAFAACSIPLLNAVPPGKPAAMPKWTPEKSATRDPIQVVPPAPSCATAFNHVGAPAPTMPPPPVAPPPAAPPAKQ